MSNKSLADLHLLGFNNWKHQNPSGFLQSSCSCFRYLQGSLAHEEIPCLPFNRQHEGQWQNCPQSFQPYFFGGGGDIPKIRIHKNAPRFVDALRTPMLWPVQQPTSLYSMRVLARTFNMLAIRGSRNFSAKASTFFSGCLKR